MFASRDPSKYIIMLSRIEFTNVGSPVVYRAQQTHTHTHTHRHARTHTQIILI